MQACGSAARVEGGADGASAARGEVIPRVADVSDCEAQVGSVFSV